jgi:predicted ATPase/GAF domain-containing protein/HPt (histidine-containing phosphotransfer) domain-containing protein/tRNA A-37 threonylcarbamoyl transferase component Bud32
MKLPGYRLEAEIAHSEHTSVQRAIRERDGRAVVIKTLSREYPSPAELRRVEFEYRVLNKLRGPGVIDALELVKTGNGLALVLEDFGGQSLAAERGPLALPEFFAIATQAVTALSRVHGLQVIHKDLKPANLLVNGEGLLKLIDFQVASEISRERQDVSVTNHLQGSLPYISPEQTGRMNRALDYRSDYYSLGCTFFELLTGKLPFQASDVMGWLHCHISKAPPFAHELNPALPVALSMLVHKLMAKEPRERYQSARGLLADLERCRSIALAGDASAKIALGQDDVSERFGLTQQLVGRAAEVERLLDIFESASRGAGRLLLVSGYSGIGKSSLIRELHKPITSKQGYFVCGKFDQLDRSLPYAALLQAVRALIRQRLAEPDQEVRAWSKSLRAALGDGIRVLCEVLPELTRVVGPQPAPEALDPVGAQNRFKHVFARFLESIAAASHPLVMFLDDLQWADSSTLDLLADLLTGHEIRHSLIIGAYRDNEVGDSHLLRSTLRQIRERAPTAISELLLQPLDEAAITELVSRTLQLAPRLCAPLALEIQRKTQGNPFFASELLTTLYREGVLSFASEQGRWVWDLDAVRNLAATDNVVHLMVHRLERLSPDELAALEVGACIGSVFSLDTLATLLERSADATGRLLWQPIQEGLLVPLDDDYRLMSSEHAESLAGVLDVSYRFQHDRVQQAAYSLIPEPERVAMHLRIGRKLLADSADRARPKDLFGVTNHLNLGQALLSELSERVALAELNREAGTKALSATAFGVAAQYYDAGAACLSAAQWQEQPELRFALFSERVGAVMMAGQRERALLLCEQLYDFAPTKADRGRVFLRKVEILAWEGKFVEAVAAVREGLALFEIDFPAQPDAIGAGIGAGIGKMQEHLARVPIDDLAKLPDMTDPERQVAMQLLFQSVPPAIMTYPPLFILAELLMFDLALSHGLTPVSAKNFVDCGMIQGSVIGDYASAYRLGQIAFQVLERYQAKSLGSQVHFVFATYVSQWGAPYAEALDSFQTSHRLGIEMGDHLHLSYAVALGLRMLLNLGRPLDECAAEAGVGQALLERIRVFSPIDNIRLCRRAIEHLRDSAEDLAAHDRADQQLTSEIVASGNAQWGFQHGQMQMMTNVLLGEWKSAQRWSEFTNARLVAASTLFTLPECYLCEVLIITQELWAGAAPEARAALDRELDEFSGKLENWARLCPANMAHKHLLAAAEIARVRGQPIEVVMSLYDQAAEATGDAFLHLRALATELHGRFWLARQQRAFALTLLRDALHMYAAWGARAKTKRLERQMLEWFGRLRLEQTASADITKDTVLASNTVFENELQKGTLDLASVLKATQAISGEVKSERLFARLMDAILENAGAEQGCLILAEEGGALWVRACASIAPGTARSAERGSERDVSVRHVLEQEPRLCPQMVRYVARTLQPLVIDEATAHPDFGSDDYVQRAKVKSVLCMPILNQGGLVAVLYVENNATTHTFTADRVETLRLIAGQAAISITNASLYESLERKVEERTRELRAKTRTIAAMLDGMQQGVFTIDEQLTVQPEYSRHLEQIVGSPDIVGRPLADVLFKGAELGADIIATNESALRFSFGSSRAIAHANADHMVKEFTRVAPGGSRQHFELDWGWILGENSKVDKVLVTARDVTLIRGLQRAAEQHAREAALMTEILDAGLDEFRTFSDAARRSLRDPIARASQPGALQQDVMRCIFRSVHTLKGHARALGLSHIVAAAHAAEDACSAPGAAAAGPKGPLLQALSALDALVVEHEAIGEKKLGRLWVGADERFKEAIGAIESALSQTSDRPSYPARALAQVKTALHRMNAVPLDQVLRETSRVFPSLALELGKSVPRIEWEDDGTLLDGDWGRLMKDALVHSFRNSIDHGIETPEERARAGKSPQGKIALRTEHDGSFVSIHLSDDGRGLPLEKLRSKTGNADGPDQDVAEAIFEFGVSTAEQVTQVSGRGAGMDAVRAFFREHGGDVSIAFTGAAAQGYRPFELVFRLPTGAALKS